MAECGRHAVSGGPEAEANDRREGMDSPGFTLHAKHRHRAGFRLAGLRPLVLRVASCHAVVRERWGEGIPDFLRPRGLPVPSSRACFTRNTGLLPVFAWRASARWCCAWLPATQSRGNSWRGCPCPRAGLSSRETPASCRFSLGGPPSAGAARGVLPRSRGVTQGGAARALEPGYGSKRSQDGEAQRTCSECRAGCPTRTSGDGAWAAPRGRAARRDPHGLRRCAS